MRFAKVLRTFNSSQMVFTFSLWTPIQRTLAAAASTDLAQWWSQAGALL